MRKFISYLLLLAVILLFSGCSNTVNNTLVLPNMNTMSEEERLAWQNDLSALTQTGYTFVTKKETSIQAGEIPVQYPKSKPTSGLWFLTKTKTGKAGIVEREYLYTYESKTQTILSKIVIPGSEVYTDATPDVYEYLKKPTVGSSFVTSGITRFGVNCVGCPVDSQGRGNTSAGVRIALDSVRQKDGTWKPGVTYEGYYILATDAAIPHCTVVEISNHNYQGMGLEPGVPFKAVVLDRGGAIKGARLDLFVGNENNLNVIRPVKSNKNLTVTILSFNKRVRNGANFSCIFGGK